MLIGRKNLTGNYELDVHVSNIGASDRIRVYYSASEDLSTGGFLEVGPRGMVIGRVLQGKESTWKTKECEVGTSVSVRILKKGGFFRYWVNGTADWMRGPLGEWEGHLEPIEAYVALDAPKGVTVESFAATMLPWFPGVGKVVEKGPEGGFMEGHVLPGALIEYDGRYYMYFMASMKGDQEGGSKRTIGVAISDDLVHWKVHPEPLISQSNVEADNIYPNGAVITHEGKVAIMYSVQKFPAWQGFCLAVADNPLGPFEDCPSNPVFKHFDHAHEFDLVRVDGTGCRYMLFYAGFVPELGGDRGFLICSDDLANWRPHPRNPVFGPETKDNWDAIHIRPRSLNRIGDTWYLWYEGCNNWIPPGTTHHGWWDTVGLARSKDLVNWEYYPRNPALSSGLTTWIGWPRMVVKDGIGYVFAIDGSEVSLRRISIDALTKWDTEGGETIDLVAP